MTNVMIILKHAHDANLFVPESIDARIVDEFAATQAWAMRKKIASNLCQT